MRTNDEPRTFRGGVIALVGLLAGGAACAATPENDGGPDGDPSTDAVMMADFTQVSWDGAGWTAGATSAAANLVHATDERLASFIDAPPSCNVFVDVETWDSNAGVSPISLTSSLQAATATWDAGASRYQIDGLVGSAIFGADDTLTVSFDGGDEVLDAPPDFADAGELLGDPAGAATRFFAPDGAFDGVFVYVVASGGSVGDSGALCWYAASTMDLDGGFRSVELLDQATVDGLAAEGLTVTGISVAYMTLAFTDGLFPDQERPAPLQAGRMINVSAADLAF